MKSTCCDKILLKYSYLAIFKEYRAPKSTFTKDLWNIYPLLQFNNLNYLKNRVEEGETSSGKLE